MNDNNISLPLQIAEARSRVESIFQSDIPDMVKELIFKEAWLRASVAANKEVTDEYKAYSERQKSEEAEE